MCCIASLTLARFSRSCTTNTIATKIRARSPCSCCTRLETLGFGGLWLIVLAVYPATWLGMSIYLALNVAYGVIGHLGVEPVPAAALRIPLLKGLTTSTFHAQHHLDRQRNFGFYTLIWDRLFGTLSPDYARDFGQLPGRGVGQ